MNDMSGKGPENWIKASHEGSLPPVGGFYAGEDISFVHPEASDPAVAELLADMMGSPVLVVPELAQVPQTALAKVYVFTNGVAGMGPMGFQPDVFDVAPGDDGYSPLRALHLVTWADIADSRQLTSATEVEQADAAGLLRIERPGVVVNMPFITWPGGHR